MSFNPFGAGRGLSTSKLIEKLSEDKNVSIPFKQGEVFRLDIKHNTSRPVMFQSLWSRAGSFDHMQALQLIQVLNSFNPFGAGRGLSTDGTEISQIFYEGLNPFRAGQGLST